MPGVLPWEICISTSHATSRRKAWYFKVLQDYVDVYLGLDARIQLLKCFYEVRDVQGLEGLLDSFRSFLKRNKQVSLTHRKNYETFLGLCRRLFHTPPGDAGRRVKLRNAVLKAPQITGKDWLLEKITELESNF